MRAHVGLVVVGWWLCAFGSAGAGGIVRTGRATVVSTDPFFEVNRGQARDEVLFLSRGRAHDLFLMGAAAVLVPKAGVLPLEYLPCESLADRRRRAPPARPTTPSPVGKGSPVVRTFVLAHDGRTDPDQAGRDRAAL